MAFVAINDFRGGLDTRRTRFTAPAGTLTSLVNAHITQGGEIEKRKAFVPTISLPAGTLGMAVLGGRPYVFGHTETPSGLPSSVSYQRLEHPDELAMIKVLRAEIFNNKLYVVAQYSDGSIYHFYNGVRIDDYVDGRSRAAFSITGGTVGQDFAKFSFTVTGGSTGSLDALLIDGVNVLTNPVAWTTDNETTAAAIVTEINGTVSTPDYTATAVGATVTVKAITAGSASNGLLVELMPIGAITFSANVGTLSGGVFNGVTSITINGLEILGVSIPFTTDNAATAQAIVNQLNTFVSDPDWTASRNNAIVNIASANAGVEFNNLDVVIVPSGNVTIGGASSVTFGGADPDNTYVPGSWAKTYKSKVYSTSGSLLHFSALNDPTNFRDGVGAGFISMNNQDGGAENLISIETYLDLLAIFARRTIQLWSVDPDPASNVQQQILRNTGTVAAASVVQFGDSDVIYLSDSGIRSLRARDASSAAAVNDIGTPIDELIVERMLTVGDATVADAIAVVEPIGGRYWLALGDIIYVHSNYPTSEISAWATYDPGFTIDAMAVSANKILVRSGNLIYTYGGLTGVEYGSDYEVSVELPFLDAGKPATSKLLESMDAVVEGEWSVFIGMDVSYPDAKDLIGRIDQPTFALGRLTAAGHGTHFGVKMTHMGEGPAKIGNLLLHYDADETG